MKILYGVQGTGNGHIARARVMADTLSRCPDIQVDYVFSGRPPRHYFDMDVFGDYRTFPGLTFVTEHGRVNRWKSIKQARLHRLQRDIRRLDVRGYDLVINDFEPITAWAARRQKVPSLSISHQAAFSYTVPKAGKGIVESAIMKWFAPTQYQLGVHWFHFNQPILPPFVMETPLAHPSNNHVLVYLPFEDIDDIRQCLEPLSDQRFQCFHPAVKHEQHEGHIHWHPTAKQRFRDALQHASGVIANGGFELASEALQLGKKLLIKPLHGQFEQLSNVMLLSQLDLCQTLFQLDTDVVEDWLTAPPTEAIEFPNDPMPLIDWLKRGNWHDSAPLCKDLWQQVKFGQKTQDKLLSLAF